MAQQGKDGTIGIGGRWWRFPGARIDTDSWEVEWREGGKLYLLESNGNIVEGVEVIDVMPPRLSSMKNHICCYFNCPEAGAIHIGPNGGNSDWICFRHYDKWHAQRARFLADGGGCEMEELGELLEGDRTNPILNPA